MFARASRGRSLTMESTGRTADSRSFKRNSVTELRKAFELNHAQPASVDLYAHAVRVESGVDFLKIFAWYGPGRPSIEIGVSGPTRIDVERFSHELMKNVSSSKGIRDVTSEVVLKDLVVSSNDDGTQTETSSAQKTAAPADANKVEGWTRRALSFIREHTAGFILSVLASILAAAILYYLGFGN